MEHFYLHYKAWLGTGDDNQTFEEEFQEIDASEITKLLGDVAEGKT